MTPKPSPTATVTIEDQATRPWAPCPTCWGQRRIFAPAANGEGLIPHPCPVCLGRGYRTVPA